LLRQQTSELFCIVAIQNKTYLEGNMQGPLRTLLAGAAAWKFGGGLFSVIIIFLVVYFLLGKC